MAKETLSPGVKRLRNIVITMGFVLVIGTFALFIAVYFKFNNSKPVVPVNSYAMQAPVQIVSQPDKCAFKNMSDVEVDSNIISSNINGNILTIITGKKQKPVAVNKIQQGNSLTLTAAAQQSTQQIIIFDLCQGIILSRLNILETN